MRTPIMSRPLLLVFASTFGATVGFYLLLSVVPLYATTIGAGGVGAGLTTGVLMLATVAAELVTPWLVARFGYRTVFAAGLVLLGAPALALPGATDLASVLVVCAIRGLGFAVIVVLGSALVALLIPQERRGEGLGIYGLMVGVPSILALPLGIWLAGKVGFGPVFVAGAAAALLGLIAVPGLPGRPPRLEEALSVAGALRSMPLLRPSIIFSATAMAAGVVVTFLPLAVPHASGTLAAFALLAQAATTTVTRWWAGRFGDRHGPSKLLLPGVLVCAAGVATLVLISSPVAVVAGMVIFGAGFGVTQNASLSTMFERASISGYGAVSALWNLAYDAGLGVGAAGFGILAANTGYPIAFGAMALLILTMLVPAWRDRRAKPADAPSVTA